MNRSFAKPIQSLGPVRTTAAQSPLLQRKFACHGTSDLSSQCESCRTKGYVPRQSGTDSSRVSEAPASVHGVLRSSGQPLDSTTRAFFEPRFGHDFSRVRVHTNAESATSAAAVNALAFTVGEHIVFRAGHYEPSSMEGRRLLAHELTHVLQQGEVRHRGTAGSPVASKTNVESVPLAYSRLEIGEPDDQFEREAQRIADRIVSGATASESESVAVPSESLVSAPASITPAPVVHRALLQRQRGGAPPPPPAAGTCPNSVDFSTGNADVHVPLCGISNVTASTAPAGIPGIAWSMAAGTAPIATGTAIGSSNGQITFATAQTGGTVRVTATQPTSTVGGPCTAFSDLTLNSNPSGIDSTFVVGPLGSTRTRYGAVFDHNFSSADGRIASLDNVPVGEEFSGVPNPTATIHTISTPFGDFDLTTRNLTPTATNNWFVTSGSLGGTHDSISIDRSLPKVGQFLQSASNPTPANTLPVGFTVTQGLFWFCRQAAAGSAWTKIRDVDHVRTLRLDSTGTGVEFVVSVNGLENAEPYTGQPAIINASANPATIPPTPARVRGGPVPTPSTTTISADPRPDPMPSGHNLRFAIRGPALGCRVNSTTGVFTAGTQTGTVTVRVSDSVRANTNFDEVVVTIAVPTPQPAPGQPAPGQPQPGPGQPQPGPGQPNPNPSPVPKTSSSTESNEES
jgi:hypothetical protein